jgi:hypothetical protein
LVANTIRILTVGVASCFRAFLDSRETLVVVGAQVARALRGVDELLVGVVVTEIDVGLFLNCRVDPAVVDAQGDYVDVLA